MIYDKDTFLKELANLPQLKTNTLSLVFALNSNIDISKKERFFDNVSPFFKKYLTTERSEIEVKKFENSIDKWQGKDLRLKRVTLKSIRGIPDSVKPYGIDFTDKNGKPQSLIILGSNGSGKSSIYSSIEYSYCKEIGEAQLRTYRPLERGSEEFEKFLEHFNNGFSKSFCEISTVDSVLDVHKENIPNDVRKIINPETHFISDYDLYVNGELDFDSAGDQSFHTTIARSLGLEELLEFEKNLRLFTIYRRMTENRNASSIEKSNASLEELITANRKSITEKQELLEKLKLTKESTPKESILEDKNTNEALELLGRLNATSISFSIDYKNFVASVNNYKQVHNEYTAKIVKVSGRNEIQFLGLGLELLKESPDCPFCEGSNHKKEEIERNVADRLAKIKAMGDATQELNKAFNHLTEFIELVLNQFSLIRSKIPDELKSIQVNVAFNELNLLETAIIEFLTKVSGEDFFLQAKDLTTSPNYLRDKHKALFDLINSHSSFIESQLEGVLNMISHFLKERKEIILKIDTSLRSKAETKVPADQIVILTKEMQDLELQIQGAEKSIDSNKAEILKIREQQVIFETIKNESIEYLKIVHLTLNKEVENAFAPIKLIVEEILQEFIDRDTRNIDLVISKEPGEIDEETGEILTRIITAKVVQKNSNNPPQSVNKYLNTFHYRLFLTMVGISIAISSRKKTQINLPLILDDIFYASDFENRSTIEDFLRKVFHAFKQFTPELELQLILFTHDQLIFESAVQAASMNKVNNMSFAKLFPYNEAKEENEYFNLIYKLPQYLPQSIMTNTLTEV